MENRWNTTNDPNRTPHSYPGQIKALDSETFQKLVTIIYRETGISLAAHKQTLVSTRIGKRMRALQLDDFRTYLKRLNADESGREMDELINAISTNTTRFFREEAHFDFFREQMKKLHNAGRRNIRIWSAAASTGEEPYSLAISGIEATRDSSSFLILATDISNSVLETAKRGIYTQTMGATLPKYLESNYFKPGPEAGQIEVNEELRKVVRFGKLNLSKAPYPLQGDLDFIFCRNVMIYFDNTVRKRIASEAWRLLRPGGFFIIGHSESLSGLDSSFTFIQPTIHRKESR